VFDVQFDFAVMWEDMAYKTASLISPGHVRRMMLPNYRKVTDLLHRAGIDIVMLDSDGNVEELIPLWLEAGINYIYPMEVAAGMDVVRLREKFGRDLIMGGGMDKRILASTPEAIDGMIDAKRDLILEGGYVPGCDHALPPDIPWANFLHYRERLAAMA
ncbi:MAG: uroporphyrinogen decarboxylase family protein, partial [Planctomycetota bacterium]